MDMTSARNLMRDYTKEADEVVADVARDQAAARERLALRKRSVVERAKERKKRASEKRELEELATKKKEHMARMITALQVLLDESSVVDALQGTGGTSTDETVRPDRKTKNMKLWRNNVQELTQVETSDPLVEAISRKMPSLAKVFSRKGGRDDSNAPARWAASSRDWEPDRSHDAEAALHSGSGNQPHIDDSLLPTYADLEEEDLEEDEDEIRGAEEATEGEGEGRRPPGYA